MQILFHSFILAFFKKMISRTFQNNVFDAKQKNFRFSFVKFFELEQRNISQVNVLRPI